MLPNSKAGCSASTVQVCAHLAFDLPVVLIMLLGFAAAAAKMLGLLPAVRPADVLLLPIVFTARLPGEVFFTGTTTLLRETHKTRMHSGTL